MFDDRCSFDVCKDAYVVFYAIGYVAYIFDVVADYAVLLVTLVDVVMNVPIAVDARVQTCVLLLSMCCWKNDS